MKRWLIWLGLGAGLLLVLYALLASKSDDELVGEQLQRLEACLKGPEGENAVFRTARYNREFSELFTERVKVDVPELSDPVQGRREVAALASRAIGNHADADVVFTGTNIDIGNVAADVKTTAVLTALRGGDLRRDSRQVRLRLIKTDGDWLIDDVNVSPAD